MNTTRDLDTHLVYPKLATERHYSGMERRTGFGFAVLVAGTAVAVALLLGQSYLQTTTREAARSAGSLAQLSQAIVVKAVQLQATRPSAAERGLPGAGTPPGDAAPLAPPVATAAEGQMRQQLFETARRFESELAVYQALGGKVGDAGVGDSTPQSLASRHRAVVNLALAVERADSRSGMEVALPPLAGAAEAFLTEIETQRAELDAFGAGLATLFSVAIGVLILGQAAVTIWIWRAAVRPIIGRMRGTISAMAERVQHDESGQRQMMSFLERFSNRLQKRLVEPTAYGSFGQHRQALNDTMSLMNLQERLMQLRVDANELKSFVELGVHHNSLEPVPMRWNEMVRGVVDRLRPDAGQRSIEIAEHYDPLCTVELLGDERKLRHVLSSAITRTLNALEVGEIRIHTHRFQSTPTHDWVRCEITAVGSFDPEEANAWVFQYCGAAPQGNPDAIPGESGVPLCGQITRMLGADVDIQMQGEDGWKISLEVKLPVRGVAILDRATANLATPERANLIEAVKGPSS